MATRVAAVAPLMVPMNPECTHIEGFISTVPTTSSSPRQYWVRLTNLPSDGRCLSGAQVTMDADLAAALHGKEELIQSRLKDSHDLASFLVELRNLASKPPARASTDTIGRHTILPNGLFAATSKAHAHCVSNHTTNRNPKFYRVVKSSMEEIGWQCIEGLAPDFSSFTVNLTDAARRRHSLTLCLPPGFPDAPPLATCDLPIAFEPHWKPSVSTLQDIVTQFEAALDRYQEIWDWLDDLDAHAWVIEPTAPTRSCMHRRLALTGHVTLVVTFDPVDIGRVPDMQLLGSEKAIEAMVGAMRERRGLWQSHRCARENIEALLGAPLPSKINARGGENVLGGGAGLGDVGGDCAICYNYRRPIEDDVGVEAGDAGLGDAPDVCCDNSGCGKPFHKECLREWLASDASTRQSFGRLFGACPYCMAPISVSTTT